MDKGLKPTCPDSDAEQSFAFIRCPENYPKWNMKSQISYINNYDCNRIVL